MLHVQKSRVVAGDVMFQAALILLPGGACVHVLMKHFKLFARLVTVGKLEL